VASSEAKTKPGSEATTTLGCVSKRSCSHQEKSTESPVSKLRHDGMRHANRTAVKALHNLHIFNINFTEFLDGRAPKGFSSRLGYWKAEEDVMFAFPASEAIFDGLLSPTDYHIWQLIVRMTELVFRQREVWEHSDAELFSRMAKRSVILIEENYGIQSCLVTAHNLQHVEQDTWCFSHPDNYWCFSFERAVKRYVGHTSNFKNPECSFAKRESLREMLKSLESTLKPLPDVGSFKYDLDKVNITNISKCNGNNPIFFPFHAI